MEFISCGFLIISWVQHTSDHIFKKVPSRVYFKFQFEFSVLNYLIFFACWTCFFQILQSACITHGVTSQSLMIFTLWKYHFWCFHSVKTTACDFIQWIKPSISRRKLKLSHLHCTIWRHEKLTKWFVKIILCRFK